MDIPTTNIILLGDSTIDNILHVNTQDKTVAGCLKKNLDEKLSGDDLLNDVIKDLHNYLVNNILNDIVEEIDVDNGNIVNLVNLSYEPDY